MISLPQIPYIHRTYKALANPTYHTNTHTHTRTHTHTHTRTHTHIYTQTHTHSYSFLSEWLEAKDKRLRFEEKTQSALQKSIAKELEWTKQQQKGQQVGSLLRDVDLL